LINDSELFVINVERGEHVGIKKIEITGNETVKDWKLKMAMKDTKQKAPWRIFKRSKFTESSYTKDKLAMMNKFNAAGLRDANISFDTVYQKNAKNLIIKINVEEGGKYYFGYIDCFGSFGSLDYSAVEDCSLARCTGYNLACCRPRTGAAYLRKR
jgi:outer membrane protein insertion porin family